MSASFLTTAQDSLDLLVAVEVAWGADITDLDGSGWTWDDITDYVILGGEDETSGSGISITLGRPDFSSETQAANMICQLDNRDGRFSGGGSSPYWPNIRRGTPVRVRVSPDAGDTWSLRFQGAADGFTPNWPDKTGRWATVTLSASGPLRKLNQGTGIYISAMREGTLADSTVVAYWPCEDLRQSDFIAPAVGGERGFFRVYDPHTDTHVFGPAAEFASYGDVPASAPFMTAVDGGDLLFPAPTGATTNEATVSGLFGNMTGLEPFDGTTLDTQGFLTVGAIMTVFTPDADSVKAWCITYQVNKSSTPYSTGLLRIQGFPTIPFLIDDSTVFDTTVAFRLLDNTPYDISLTLDQSGSTTDWALIVRKIGETGSLSFSGSVDDNDDGASVSDVSAASFSDSEGLAVGHIVVRDEVVPGNHASSWSNGHPGETSQARLERLCTGHGIHLEVVSATDVPNSSIVDGMGPQFYDTLTNLLRETERTGQGLLYDGLSPGLRYVTKRGRETSANSAATLVIDASAGHLMEPFDPIDDDQLLLNRCDVSRRGGTSDTYSDLTGPEGVQAVGEFSTSIDVNPDTDDGLVHYAEWIVGLGTQPGYRYPTVTLALETNPDLIEDWLACQPTSRIDIQNITAIRRQHPDHDIRLLIEGWHETIDAFTWRVTTNTGPQEPWNVAVMAAATGTTGDGVGRLQTVSSQLASNYTSGTTISVRTNSGNRWVTSSEDSDSFPFDIDVGGIKATVTGISGTSSSGQTFTLSAALPRAMTGSTTPGPPATPVRVWRPPVYGL